MIYFVDEVGPSAAAQSVAIRDLPLRDVGQNPISFILLSFSDLNICCLIKTSLAGIVSF